MRRLILLRHAKSARPPGVADRERPLDARGRRAAPAVGAHLAACLAEHPAGEGPRPGLALVSPARRARETWEAMAAALGAVEARAEPEIYEAPAASILAAVRAAPDAAAALIVVGHNPGLGDLALELVGEGPGEARARLAAGFPTAAYAVIGFADGSWAGIAPGRGRLERFVRPRDIDPDLGG